MELLRPVQREHLSENEDFIKVHQRYCKILAEVEQRNPDSTLVEKLNEHTSAINAFDGDVKPLLKQYWRSQNKVVRQIERDLKLVPKGYYRNLWMILGLSVFGIPFGVAFATALGNIAFIGIGLPIGMPIGLAVGTAMDQKAEQEGRQLDVSLN